MDDLLTLLEKEDEELVEEVVIPAHFDLVQHIASILGQTKPMKTAGNDYTMNIVLAQLHDKIGPNNFAEIIKKENPLPVVCFREIALARDWKKSKSDFPESIKAYAALFAEHVAQAEPAEDVQQVNQPEPDAFQRYRTCDAPLLAAAHLIVQRAHGFEQRLATATNHSQLREALLLHAVAELIHDGQRDNAVQTIADANRRFEDCFLYAALLAAGHDIPFEKAVGYRKQQEKMKDLLAQLETDAKAVQEPSYQRIAHTIFDGVLEIGRVILVPPIASRTQYEQFRKDLLENVLGAREVLPGKLMNDNLVAYIKGKKFPLGTLGHFHSSGPWMTAHDQKREVTPHQIVRVKPTDYKTGDKVMIVNSGNAYTQSRDGSWGYVKRIWDKVDIEFHHLTGNQQPLPVTYDINKQHVELMGKVGDASDKKDVAAKLDAIVSNAEKQLRSYETARRNLLQQYAWQMEEAGLSFQTINYLLNAHVGHTGSSFIDELNALNINPQQQALALVADIEQKMGIIIDVKDVTTLEHYDALLNGIMDRVGIGYRISGAVKKGCTARIILDGVEVPKGKIVKVQDMCGGQYHVNYQQNQFHIPPDAMQTLVPLASDKIAVGCDVAVVGNVMSGYWNGDYLAERMKNIAIGEKGKVVDAPGNNKYVVQFPKKLAWSRNWNETHDFTKGFCHFVKQELRVVAEDTKMDEKTLHEILAAHQMRQDAAAQRLSIAQRSISDLLAVGYTWPQIEKVFEAVSYRDDLVKAGIL